MGRRRRARECALQMLFQMDLTGVRPDEVFRSFWEGREAEPEVREFAERLVRGVFAERGHLDRMLAGVSEHWRVERMAVVDRNVLRMALYEMLFQGETPPAVVMDEAIEIAKRFGSEGSGSFINGVLDAVRSGVQRGDLEVPESGPGEG